MLPSLIAAAALGAPLPSTPDPLPAGPPPLLAFVRLAANGELIRRVTVNQSVARLREVKVLVGGQETTQKVTEYVTVPVHVSQVVRAKGLQGFDTLGKPIPAERLAELIKKDTLVLISADGKPVDPAYLRVIKEGIPVLVLPQPPAPPAVPAPRGQGDR